MSRSPRGPRLPGDQEPSSAAGVGCRARPRRRRRAGRCTPRSRRAPGRRGTARPV